MPGATSYHHGNLREALVREAVEAARADGPSGLALRELARRVGVSHNAAYRHFAHRGDLVAAVAAHAMSELMGLMQQRLGEVVEDHPVRRARLRLAEVGRAYVDYAVDQPGLFQVAFSSRTRDPATLPPEDSPFALLGQLLDDLVAVGFLAPADRPGAEVTCWSMVHGFAMLSVAGLVGRADPAAGTSDLDRMLVAIDRSYAATSGTEVRGDDLLPWRPTGRG